MNHNEIDEKLLEIEKETKNLENLLEEDTIFIENQLIQFMLENNLTEMTVNGERVSLIREEEVNG